MYILLGDSITPSFIDAAEQMLFDFGFLIPELYGETACTHNVHLLTHLAKYVRLWGLLWTHSTFRFESKNGYLKKFFIVGMHSTNNLFSIVIHLSHCNIYVSTFLNKMLEYQHFLIIENAIEHDIHW